MPALSVEALLGDNDRLGENQKRSPARQTSLDRNPDPQRPPLSAPSASGPATFTAPHVDIYQPTPGGSDVSLTEAAADPPACGLAALAREAHHRTSPRPQQQPASSASSTQPDAEPGRSSSSAIVIDDNVKDALPSCRLADPSERARLPTDEAAPSATPDPSRRQLPMAMEPKATMATVLSPTTVAADSVADRMSVAAANNDPPSSSDTLSVAVELPESRPPPIPFAPSDPAIDVPLEPSRLSLITPIATPSANVPPVAPISTAAAAAAVAAISQTPVPTRRSRSAAGLGSNAGLKGVGSQAEKVEIRRLVHDCRDRLYFERQNRPPDIFLSNRPWTAFGPSFVAFVGRLGPAATTDSEAEVDGVEMLPILPLASSGQAEAAIRHDGPEATPAARSSTAALSPSFEVVDEEAEALAFRACLSTPSTTVATAIAHTASSSDPSVPTAPLRSSSRRPLPPAPSTAAADDDSSTLSDAFFLGLHRRYEAFERRLKIREREALRHGRYKLKERTELIRSMDGRSFANLVGSLPTASSTTTTGSNGSVDPAFNAEILGSSNQPKGLRVRRQPSDERRPSPPPIEPIEPEEVRARMLEEAEDLLAKYDQMLPSERARQAQHRRIEALDNDDEADATSPPGQAYTSTVASSSRHSGGLNGTSAAADASSSSLVGGRSATHLALSGGGGGPALGTITTGAAAAAALAVESTSQGATVGEAARKGATKGTPSIKLRLSAARPSSSSSSVTEAGSLARRKQLSSASEDGRQPKVFAGDVQHRKILLRTRSSGADGGGGKRLRRSSVGRQTDHSLAQAIDVDVDEGDGGSSSDGRRRRQSSFQPPPAVVYVPYIHVEYYIQPAERYSDRAALVQEANRRMPEILAAERRRLAEQQNQTSIPSLAASQLTTRPLPMQQASPSIALGGTVSSAVAVDAPEPPQAGPSTFTYQPPELHALSRGPATDPRLVHLARMLTPHLALDSSAPFPFHSAAIPPPITPVSAPARTSKLRQSKAKATGPAPVRAARHFLPWGVPPPRMLEFKSDFALDGELWTLPLAEREAQRRAQAEDAAAAAASGVADTGLPPVSDQSRERSESDSNIVPMEVDVP